MAHRRPEGHKKPDRHVRRELRRASRPPSIMTRRTEIGFWTTLVVAVLILAIIVVITVLYGKKTSRTRRCG